MSIFSGAEVLLCFDEIAVHLEGRQSGWCQTFSWGGHLEAQKYLGTAFTFGCSNMAPLLFVVFLLDQGRCEFSQLHIDIPGRSCTKSFHSKGYAILKGWEKKLQIRSKSCSFHRFWDDWWFKIQVLESRKCWNSEAHEFDLMCIADYEYWND